MLHRMRRGKYLKSTKHVSVIKGKEVVVELDYPRTLQMDGEMIENVKEYAVRFGAPMKRAKRNV